MSNKLVKEQGKEKESVLYKLLKQLIAPAKGSTKGIPNWYWYLFLIVVAYSLFTIRL